MMMVGGRKKVKELSSWVQESEHLDFCFGFKQSFRRMKAPERSKGIFFFLK